jgi:predicted glycosyltransferase
MVTKMPVLTTERDPLKDSHANSWPQEGRDESMNTAATLQREAVSTQPKKIWIDLENSPHVPFFKPIIEELERRGHSVILTARDCFQVCDLADLFQMKYRRIGRHYGKHSLAKLTGLGIRILQMTPGALWNRPDLSLSHGSRSQFLLSSLLRIPTLTIFDYEHSRWLGIKPTWVMMPEVIPDAAGASHGLKKERMLRYPGIKDPAFREKLGIPETDLLVTIRPPATEAHYHNPEAEELLAACFEILGARPNTRVVLAPRTPKQEAELREQFPRLFAERKVIVPEHVVDGLDMIWASDLVISGGGTMNREAAALGVPVYSIFRGKIGAVDQYLSDAGRLVLLESAADVHRKLQVVRRARTAVPDLSTQRTLQAVVDNIVMVLESSH